MERRHAKQQNKGLTICLIVLVALLVGGGTYWWLNRNTLESEADQIEGSIEGLSQRELDELMKNKVNEGMFTISIASHPQFKDGKSKGELQIENSAQNRYLMVVRIVRRDTKEEIYKSGAIKPGYLVPEAKLDVELPKGSYPVTAYFEAYDPESKDYVGKAASELVIDILN